MEYRFCKPLGLILVTSKSVLTGDEVRAFHKKLIDDPEIPPGMRELMDLRNVDLVAVDARIVTEISGIESARSARVGAARIAVVAPRPVAFGLSRMYEALSADTPKKVNVFTEIDPALEWLGISREELKQHMPDFKG
jgi:hypothetical protein